MTLEEICNREELLSFDFENKTIKKGKEILFEPHMETQLECNEDPWETLQKLYDNFVNSVPHKEKTKWHFKGKRVDELSYEQFMNNEDRIKAGYRLEAFIIMASVSGLLIWNNPKHWFWKGKRGLIIYRDWIGENYERD